MKIVRNEIFHFDEKCSEKVQENVGKNSYFVKLGKDSDSAESLLDSVEYRIPPNPLDSAESESESKDSVVHYSYG